MSVVSLLHDQGERIVVCYQYIDEDGKKRGFSARHFISLSEAERYAAKKNNERANVYIKHAQHVTPPTQGWKLSLSTSDFAGSRTFFVDVDFGEGKEYGTIGDVVLASKHAFTELSKLNLLPPNLVLQTGGGMHYCWVLTEVIPAVEWQALAKIFFGVFDKIGLKYDRACKTIDKGVRYTDSNNPAINYKHSTNDPIRILRETQRYDAATFKASLVALSPELYQTESAYDPKEFDEYNVYEISKFNLPTVADECAMLKATIANGGVDDDYKQWFDKLLLIAKSNDEAYAREVAQAISKGHKDWDQDATDAKFDAALASEVRFPVRCDTFADHKNSPCPTCKYYKKIRNPGQIERYISAQATTQSQGSGNSVPANATNQVASVPAPITVKNDGLPNNLYYNAESGLRRIKINDDLPDCLIWSNVNIFNVKLAKEDGGSALFLEFTFQRQNSLQISLPVNRIPDSRALAHYMATQYYIPITEAQRKGLHAAMVSWIETLRQRQMEQANPIETHYSGMGWSRDYTSFALSNFVINADGSQKPIHNDEMRNKFRPHGSIDKQKNILKSLYQNEQRPEAHAMLASSLAAPLLRLVGCQGMCFNFYSARSGYGKSTILKAGASLWGEPAASIIGVDDTYNAVIKRMTILNNLPAFFDELRVNEPEEYVKSIIFRVAQGMEKNRMNTDNGLHQAGHWQTLLVFATNVAFTGLIRGKLGQGDAASARYMDFILPPIDAALVSNSINMEMQVSELEANNGHIGCEYISHVVTNRSSVVSRLNMVSNKILAAAQTARDDASGRKHVLASACLLVATELAVKLKLLPIDQDMVAKAVAKAIKAGKTSRLEAQDTINPLTILHDYLKANEGDRLVTAEKGKYREVIMAPRSVRGTLGYEIDRTGKMILIDHAHFMQWLRIEGYNVADAMQGLASYNSGQKKALGRGTQYVTSLRRVLVVDIPDDPTHPLHSLLGA